MRDLINKLKPYFPANVKTFSKEVVIRLNSLTAGKRMTPNFIICGVQKGGTTALYDYLVEHDSILPLVQKEIHYFDYKYEKGNNWYLGNFPLKPSDPSLICGEATPTYIYSRNAAERIKKDYPNTKLIFLLRNPVARSVSDYYYGAKLGIRTRNIDEMKARMETEMNYLKAHIADLKTSKDVTELVNTKCHYLGPSLYNLWMKNWFELFDESQIKVIQSENLFGDTANVMEDLLTYLELDTKAYLEKMTFKRKNSNFYPDVEEGLKNELEAFFKDSIKELSEITKTSFTW